MKTHKMDLNHIPRNEIDWFSAIDYQKCDGCGVCIEFCPNGVY
ncbi:MAG: 4Fe-4S binding protein [Actinomycetota bacterium]